MGQTFGMEGKHLSHRRVQQLICGSLNGVRTTQTNLAIALYTPERDTSPLEHSEVGAGAQGLESKPRARSAVDHEETA